VSNLRHRLRRSIMGHFGRAMRLMSLVLAVGLLSVTFIGGVHHHAGVTCDATCVVCSASHAPAVPTTIPDAPRALVRGSRIEAHADELAPAQDVWFAPQSRGPPAV
jgi:hypothetical protein